MRTKVRSILRTKVCTTNKSIELYSRLQVYEVHSSKPGNFGETGFLESLTYLKTAITFLRFGVRTKTKVIADRDRKRQHRTQQRWAIETFCG
ncbi:MAG: hypothetical protein MUE44_26595 [Oscillatoriaceae cyanobacterium Prado104]|nr:hypothetical protein [Oscillatoriaceae cyanobacterium Prado104]